jgi:hypothetical protein
MQPMASVQPFIIKDCALSAIATGERASRLDEFRDKLIRVPIGCIYHHFWGGLLHARFAHPDYHNDFSSWAHHGLHDQVLAERLNIIDPTDFNTLEDLRHYVLEVIEGRLDEQDVVPVSKKEQQFYFIRSQTIVFQTPYQIHHPSEFEHIIPKLSSNSIFFHFIEGRRHESKTVDDFSHWLKIFGDKYNPLIERLKEIDPYFLTLKELKDELIQTFSSYFKENPYETKKGN